jgi:hypothetical protein
MLKKGKFPTNAGGGFTELIRALGAVFAPLSDQFTVEIKQHNTGSVRVHDRDFIGPNDRDAIGGHCFTGRIRLRKTQDLSHQEFLSRAAQGENGLAVLQGTVNILKDQKNHQQEEPFRKRRPERTFAAAAAPRTPFLWKSSHPFRMFFRCQIESAMLIPQLSLNFEGSIGDRP